jgi:multicomponent Na+:H+ antiporter subunit F
MIEIALKISFGGLILSILLGLLRMAKGPSVIDRILAFDTIATCAVGMVILLSIQWHSPFYLELVLAFSLLGFVTTIAFVYHLNKTYQLDAEAERRAEEMAEEDRS